MPRRPALVVARAIAKRAAAPGAPRHSLGTPFDGATGLYTPARCSRLSVRLRYGVGCTPNSAERRMPSLRCRPRSANQNTADFVNGPLTEDRRRHVSLSSLKPVLKG